MSSVVATASIANKTIKITTTKIGADVMISTNATWEYAVIAITNAIKYTTPIAGTTIHVLWYETHRGLHLFESPYTAFCISCVHTSLEIGCKHISHGGGGNAHSS